MIPNIHDLRAFGRRLLRFFRSFLEWLRPGKTFLGAILFTPVGESDCDGGSARVVVQRILAIGPVRLRRGQSVVIRREGEVDSDLEIASWKLVIADPHDFGIKDIRIQGESMLLSEFPVPAAIFVPPAGDLHLSPIHLGKKVVVEIEVCR